MVQNVDSDTDYSAWVMKYLQQLQQYEPIEKAAKALTVSLKPAKKAKAKAKASA